jgi:hypothetical protein
MWRRRPIPPFRHPVFGKAGMGMTPANPKLMEANRLLENGDYAASAVIFEDLAEKALSKQIPQSPHLFLLAGFARMKAGEIESAIVLFKKGLGLLVERKKWGHLRKASENTIERLKINGFKEQAGELQTWLDEQIPTDIKALPIWIEGAGAFTNKKKLPSRCPTCGGPINPKELEWFGSNANCNYCGTLITGE